MAALASDAYPSTLLGDRGATNAKYDVSEYLATLRARWGALGARRVEVVDDASRRLEAHAVVAATATDVVIAFRGTSTPEGWAANARISPWRLNTAGEGAGGPLQVHGGFLESFAAVYPRVADAAAAALGSLDDPGSARVFLTGHSLGGAHAMLTALALADGGARIGGVWTFGAPKVGKVRGLGGGGGGGGKWAVRAPPAAGAPSPHPPPTLPRHAPPTPPAHTTPRPISWRPT
jgi:hypothetical protein